MARLRISQKLSNAIQTGALTVSELCQALGINAANLTNASELWEAIIDRYMAERGIA
jgi:hypothetical protein